MIKQRLFGIVVTFTCVHLFATPLPSLAQDEQKAINVTEVSDDPQSFLGKNVKLMMLASPVLRIEPIVDSQGAKIFDGALCSGRLGNESFGNQFGLQPDKLNIVISDKKMARALLDLDLKHGGGNVLWMTPSGSVRSLRVKERSFIVLDLTKLTVGFEESLKFFSVRAGGVVAEVKP